MGTNKKNNRLVFSGYYGMSNFGDDLFCLSCILGSQKYWPNADGVILSPPIDGVSGRFAVPKNLTKEYAGLGVLGKCLRLFYAFKEAVDSGTVIYGGGSVFETQNGVRSLIQMLAHIMPLTFAGLGVSIGPFRSKMDEILVFNFLNKFQYITLRDSSSFEWAVSNNLACKHVFAGDLVGALPALLPDYKISNAHKSNRVLGVSLCNYESIVGGNVEIESIRNEKLMDAVVEFALKEGMVVHIFVLNGNRVLGDDSLAQRLSMKLSLSGIMHKVYRYPSDTIFGILEKIANTTVFLSVRLHGAIPAYLAGVPFLLVEYHKKCSDFLDDIGQAPNFRIAGLEFSVSDVVNILDSLLANPNFPTMSPMDYSKLSLMHFTEAPWALKHS